FTWTVDSRPSQNSPVRRNASSTASVSRKRRASAPAAPRSAAWPSRNTTSVSAPRGSSNFLWSPAHGSRAAPTRPGRPPPAAARQPAPPEGRRRRRRPVPPQELGAVPGERPRPAIHLGERDGGAEVRVEGVAGKQGAGLGVGLGDDVHRRLVARRAQDPLG